MKFILVYIVISCFVSVVLSQNGCNIEISVKNPNNMIKSSLMCYKENILCSDEFSTICNNKPARAMNSIGNIANNLLKNIGDMSGIIRHMKKRKINIVSCNMDNYFRRNSLGLNKVDNYNKYKKILAEKNFRCNEIKAKYKSGYKLCLESGESDINCCLRYNNSNQCDTSIKPGTGS